MRIDTGGTRLELDNLGTGAVPSGVAAVPSSIYSTSPAVLVANAGKSQSGLLALGYTGTAFSNIASTVSFPSDCRPANVAVGPTTTLSSTDHTAAVYVACPGNGTIEVGTLENNNGTVSLGGFAADAASGGSPTRCFAATCRRSDLSADAPIAAQYAPNLAHLFPAQRRGSPDDCVAPAALVCGGSRSAADHTAG